MQECLVLLGYLGISLYKLENTVFFVVLFLVTISADYFCLNLPVE